MKKILLFIVCLIAIVTAKAQTPNLQWAKSFGGYAYNMGYSLAVDASGNVYTTGSFNGTIDFDPGPGVYNLTDTAGAEDVFILKLDASGHFLWAKRMGSVSTQIGKSIAVDALGNSYIAGTFIGTVDFDPGAGSFYLASSGYEDVFIIKLDPSGNFVWAKKMGGASSDNVNAISLDTLGNVYSTGSFQGTVDFDPGAAIANYTSNGSTDIFISKLDAAGNFMWADQIGGASDDIGRAVSIDKFGSVLSTGSFKSAVDFDPGATTFNLTALSSNEDIYISKLDAAGNFVWAKKMGGPAHDFSNAIATDLSGNVYTTGYFTGTSDFDPSAAFFTMPSGSGSDDVYISKLDSAGNFVWAKKFEAGFGMAIAVDNIENVYTTGIFNSQGDFDPGAGTYLVNGASDIYFSKLDISGNFVWAKGLLGTAGNDVGMSIKLDAAGNIYSTGEFQGTIDFDISAGTYNLYSNSGESFFVYKIGPAKVDVWPGDADHNNIVDNNDLLPIGLYYGQNGIERDSTGNSWQADYSIDWCTMQNNGADIKHTDCNGDSLINANDTLAINLNFSLTHAIGANNTYYPERMPAPAMYLVTSSNMYNAGDLVDVEVWLGTAGHPINNLYGIAFNINYPASLVQSGSESLIYPGSWFGTPGVDALKISKFDALTNTAYGAETRIDHMNANGFGKIADFKFQLKNTIPPNTNMTFSISNYKANDSAGVLASFITLSDSITVNPSAIGIKKTTNDAKEITVYPNPTDGMFNVIVSSQTKNTCIEVYNSIGILVYKQKALNENTIIELTHQANGLYFVKVMSDDKIIGMQKIMKQ